LKLSAWGLANSATHSRMAPCGTNKATVSWVAAHTRCMMACPTAETFRLDDQTCVSCPTAGPSLNRWGSPEDTTKPECTSVCNNRYKRRPTQGDALEQLRGAQFVLVDRERFQNVQSSFHGPDAIAAVGAHAKTLQNLAMCRVYRNVRLMDKPYHFDG
jgi:hypothetical protein